LPTQRRLRADLVFTRKRIAVFIDGCFWHGCSEHFRPARKNADFWTRKIADNRQRDMRTDALLHEAGWTVLRFWEHEPVETVVATIVTTAREL
jgi:DNA mismatch endonuclease (patch repair protein)